MNPNAILTVPTIARLKSLVVPAQFGAIDVLGYNTPGDGGGGTFWLTTVNPGVDNGGTIIWSNMSGYYYTRLIDNAIYADWFGVRYQTNAQDVLEAANVVASTLGYPLYLPPVTLNLLCNKTKTPLGATRKYALNLPSNTNMIGTPGLTVLKIADSQSSNLSPLDLNIFVQDEAFQDVSFYGIIFDCNGQNNPINNGFQCNGAINITGDTAYVERMVIDNCQFKNCAGTNNIVLAQNTNGTPGTLSSSVIIRNCYFTTNGFDTPDHTSIFGWAERMWVEDCRFFQPDSQSRIGHNWVAVELHGAENWFINCEVINYYRGCWCSSNFTRDARGQWVLNNKFDVWGVGVGIFRELSSLTPVVDIFIQNNSIILRCDAAQTDMFGIVCNTLYSVNDHSYIGNKIIASGSTTYNVYGCLIGCGTNNQTNQRITFENNEISYTVSGFYVRVNNGEGILNDIVEKNNSYYFMGTCNITPTSYGSLYIQNGTSTVGRITSVGNRHIGDGSAYDNGIFTSGSLGPAVISDNYMAGVTTQLNYSAIIAVAFGNQAMRTSGTTAQRPAYLAPKDTGTIYYDTTLSKVIMWNGSAWL